MCFCTVIQVDGKIVSNDTWANYYQKLYRASNEDEDKISSKSYWSIAMPKMTDGLEVLTTVPSHP